MTNVISLQGRLNVNPRGPEDQDRARAAVVAELTELLERLRRSAEHAACLSGPTLQVQRSAQHILDAMTALERAADDLTNEGRWYPF